MSGLLSGVGVIDYVVKSPRDITILAGRSRTEFRLRGGQSIRATWKARTVTAQLYKPRLLL